MSRERRLAGAGLNLPAAFTVVLEDLLDNGESSGAELGVMVRDAMRLKERRVLSLWGDWAEFTADILGQLEDRGLIREEGGTWYLTPAFVPGYRHEIIPSGNISVTVHERGDRERREASAMLRAEIRRLLTDRKLAGADAYARSLLEEASGELSRAMEGRRHRRNREPGADAPDPEQLAREKYGYDGGVPSYRVRNVFGPDGLRPCSYCNKRLPPSAYSPYYHRPSGHWVLPSGCAECGYNGNKWRRKHGGN